jgi:hypothetical protein
LGLDTVLAHFFMKQFLFNIIRVFFLKKGIWIRFYYNQKTKDFVWKSPYKEIFKKNQKQLMYLGTRHVRDPGSEYIKHIWNNFVEFKPDCVVYEQSIRSQSWVDTRESRINDVLIDNNMIDKLIRFYGESGYADYLGRRSGNTTVMIEPSGEEIFDYLLKYYKKEEVFLYHCLSYLHDNNKGLRDNPEALEQHFIDQHRQHNDLVFAKTGIEITKANFFYYEKKILNHQFDLYGLGPWKLTRVDKLSRYITQKISKSELYYRDKKIVEGIYELTKKYDRIAVVYGNTHYLSQRKVIEQMYKWLV